MTLLQKLKLHWDKAALAFIMLLAGVQTIYGIWDLGNSNAFYAACVKSMTLSWKNFFFVALDPGGWVTVDKPPVSLWVQAIFAKIFGFHSWSFLLPQCLAAVAMVGILFHIVKRHFGKIAGLISALVLALSPIFIVVSKTNNTDTILIFFMVLSAWAMMVAADKGQLRYLLLSMVLLGVAYNAKTLEAFLILPALYATYFFATNLKWRTRIWHLAVATAVLLAVSLSWSVIVDLTPASERPYVDSSSNNSEIELALGYNGIQRVTGQNRGGMSGKTAPSAASGNDSASGATVQSPQEGTSSDNPFGAASAGTSGSTATAQDTSLPAGGPGNAPGGPGNSSMRGGNMPGGGGMPSGHGGGGGFNGGGSASVLRMFNSTLGGQDSWLLPFGFFGIFALLFGLRKSETPDRETRRKYLRNALLWGISLITMFTFFDVANFFHEYYVSVMGPFLAALVGIGAARMWEIYKAGGLKSFLLPAALLVTLFVQTVMLSYFPAYGTVLIPVVAVIAGIPAVALIVLKLVKNDLSDKIRIVCAAVSIAGLLIAPAVWTSYSAFSLNFNAAIPSAGPSSNSRGMPGQHNSAAAPGAPGQSKTQDSSTGSTTSASYSSLSDFLVKNNTREKWLVAVGNAGSAEPIILATGKPVICIGGFSGNDNTLSLEKLKQLVTDGELKYFMVGGGMGGGPGGGSDELTAWVKENGTAVDASQWGGSSSSDNTGRGGMGDSGTLYDLSSCKAASSSN